jgi:3-deoxy-manno-octulosonate cytidylyltransferase (CMP-KDO synthetase)
MASHIVIPARFASSRLPGKPLLEINNKPLIWHVYQRALETNIRSIVVATDHIDIFNVVTAFGGNVVMTSVEHVNGTERLAEVAQKMSFSDNDIVINLQGDEPLIPSTLIEPMATLLDENPSSGIATLCCRIGDAEQVFNPNVVKVTKTDAGKALYFSRAPIPWDRECFKSVRTGNEVTQLRSPYYRHIGMYSYRVNTLKQIATLAESTLESCESLEQLRALQAGIEIQVGEIEQVPPHGVDTMEDYLNVKRFVEDQNES